MPSYPTPHTARVGSTPETCDVCKATIPAQSLCYITLRHVYAPRGEQLVAVAPESLLLCDACGRGHA